MNRIRDLREDMDMTQAQLGELLKVQKSAVSKYELGKLSLSDQLISRLCEIFQVSADYLLCRTDVRTLCDLRKSPQRGDEPLPYATDETREAIELLSKLNPINLERALDHLEYLLARQEASEEKR